LVCVAALIAPAAGQNPPVPPATARTVVASTKLPMLGDAPVHFKAVSVTIPSGKSSSVSATKGIVYQLSGSTEVSIGGEVKTLSAGESLFILDASYLSGADAVQPAAPSVRRSALLHRLRNGRKHGRSQGRGQGAGFVHLRTVRSGPSVGKPRYVAIYILGVQHQPGRCARCPSRGAGEESVAFRRGAARRR
jgi:hypothetical protein